MREYPRKIIRPVAMKHPTNSLLTVLGILMLPTAASASYTYKTTSGHYEYSGSAAFGSTSHKQGWTAYAAAEWVSRYIRRGYQQFGNAGAFGIMLGGGYGPVGVDLEQRFADTSADREFRGTMRASRTIDQFDFGVRATYMSDLRGGPSNWDLGFGVGSQLFYGIQWNSEIYYGTEPSNFYLDAGLSREWEFGPEWSLTASAAMGFNLGYQREARKGADHIALGLDVAHAINHQSVIYGGIGHHSTVNRDASRYSDHTELYEGFIFRVGARWEY